MRIISDTSTLYSPEEGAALGVHIIPASIIYRDKAYRDFIDITTDKFLHLVQTGATPTSSQPAIGDLFDVFEESKTKNIERIPNQRNLSLEIRKLNRCLFLL